MYSCEQYNRNKTGVVSVCVYVCVVAGYLLDIVRFLCPVNSQLPAIRKPTPWIPVLSGWKPGSCLRVVAEIGQKQKTHH